MRLLLLIFFILLPFSQSLSQSFVFDETEISERFPQKLLDAENQLLLELDSLRKERNNSYKIRENLRELCWMNINSLNNHERADSLASLGIELCKLARDTYNLCTFYNIKTRTLENKGLFHSALENAFTGIKIRESVSDSNRLAYGYQLVGRILSKQKKFTEALKYLDIASSIRKKLNQPVSQYILRQRAFTLSNMGEFDKALDFAYRSLKITKAKKNQRATRNNLIMIGHIKSMAGDFEGSNQLLDSVFNNVGPHLSESAIHSIRMLYIKNLKDIGNLDEAEIQAKKLYPAISKAKNIRGTYLLLEHLAKISSGKGDWARAYEYEKERSLLASEIYNSDILQTTTDFQTQYETEKKEEKIYAQELELISEKQRQTKQLFVFGLIGLLLIGVSYYLWKRSSYLSKLSKQQSLIQEQQINELEQRNKIVSMTAMMDGEEKERMRIARDLHDGMGGLLSTIKAHFNAILHDPKTVEQSNLVSKTNELIEEACVEVRQVSHNMMPHAISLSGLGGALEDLSEKMEIDGLKVNLEIEDDLTVLTESQSIMIYRIIQELCNNIHKHAQASTVLIQALLLEDQLQIIVEDNGKGFDYESEDNQEGLGLRSIRSRVEYLNGDLDIDSKSDAGTSVTINMPLKAKSE